MKCWIVPSRSPAPSNTAVPSTFAEEIRLDAESGSIVPVVLAMTRLLCVRENDWHSGPRSEPFPRETIARDKLALI
jgi:hypothetical protein